ncbi:DUF6338 family protein [Allokutzneria sp. A3M-2-11 16]|uniref:DUF6338 family protein n=1 Tax=Allokutzneria sp. A3M-2-11 16 TaxID=2962043 RepID=UPI0020B84E8A|nr:DUF6338 family protein [Allokutzneria sp. A3M-2-11 16]MCP3797951.1 DUF6338 family protein [Allokutzneria sp. A3M-2-11 16]
MTIPASAIGLVVFFLAVAPGTCYELLRGRTLLPREESTFLQVSRVLLAGTLITALTVLLMSLVAAVAPSAFIDVAQLIVGGEKYIAANVLLCGWTILVQLVLSALLAVVFSGLRTPRQARPILQVDAWHRLTEEVVPSGYEVQVSVRLKSGREIVGRYLGASTDLDPTKRELKLQEPLFVRESDKEESVPLVGWQTMVIMGGEIESLAFCYKRVSGEEEQGKPTRLSRVGLLGSRWLLSWQLAATAAALLLFVIVLIGNADARMALYLFFVWHFS